MSKFIDWVVSRIEKRMAARIAAGTSSLPAALEQRAQQLVEPQFSLRIGKDGCIAGIAVSTSAPPAMATFDADRVWAHIEKQIAEDIAVGTGALSQAFESRYGIRRAAR